MLKEPLLVDSLTRVFKAIPTAAIFSLHRKVSQNTPGTGKGCTSGRPCPSTLTQAVPRALGTVGRGTGLAVTPVCHRSPPCTTRSRSTWGEAHPPRTPSSARVRPCGHPSTTAAPLMPPSPGSSVTLQPSPRRHHLSAAAAAALTAANELQAAIWVIYSPKVTASNCSSAYRPRCGVRVLGAGGQGERHVLSPPPPAVTPCDPRAP